MKANRPPARTGLDYRSKGERVKKAGRLEWKLRLPFWVLLLSWIVFGLGATIEYGYGGVKHGLPTQMFLLCLTAAIPIAAKVIGDQRGTWWPALLGKLEEHTLLIDALPTRFDGIWVALAAGLGLYAELVLIRFHASCFQLFAFFKNLSLLSCFLGLGIGYTLGRKRPLFTPLVLPLFAVQMIFLHALRYSGISQTLHNPIQEQLALGMDQMVDWNHTMTVYGFMVLVFCLNALCFIPLGHLAAYLMGRVARLPGYSWNLVGSLAGILLFYGMSFAWTGPIIWVAALVLMLLPFIRGRGALMTSAASAAVLLAVLAFSPVVDHYDLYTPYQILSIGLSKDAHPTIQVNHVYFQKILDLRDNQGPAQMEETAQAREYYALPYLFKPKPANVLIVGSGTGNDVASALRHGAGHVDAVEIDPAILQLGWQLHPEEPYASPKVTAHVQDARAFIRYTRQKFDLIVFGLLDSHTQLSSMSGVRLDSYIYTTDSIRDARKRLAPGGLISLNFCVFKQEMARKIFLMVKDAFDGKEPIVYETAYDGGTAFVIGDDMPLSLRDVKVPGARPLSTALSENKFMADPSTDDWPFFYMPVRKYPVSYVVMIAVLLLVSATFLWPVFAAVAPRPGVASVARAGSAFSVPCFLLGAGFMLLETKAITELALVFGSTWVVIAVVITAILLLAFLGNLLLIRVGSVNSKLVYLLLLAAVAFSLAFSYFKLPAEIWGGRMTVSLIATAVITSPMFFAGIVFSSELKKAVSPGIALGSNLIGAMLGGCLEYNSMYLGYRALYFIAFAIYFFAFVISLRCGAPAASDCPPTPQAKAVRT